MGALLALTLFGSVIWFWVSVLIFLFIVFASDINENGFYAFGSLIIISAVYYFWGDVKPILPIISLLNISIYLGIGLVFSTLRTFFAGRELGKLIKDLPITNEKNKYDSDTKEYQKERFVNRLKGNVFRWWFMWPISLINWLISDLIADIWDYVYSKLSGFYNYVVELGIKSVGLK